MTAHITAGSKSITLTPNQLSAFISSKANNGGGATGTVWTATVDYDHANAGILQFQTSRVDMTATGDAMIYIERTGGYAGSVTARVKTNSTTGDCAMTAGADFTAQDIEVSFADQEVGVKSVTVPVTNVPRSGLNIISVTMDTPNGGVTLRNPECQIYVDDGGVNPNATIFTTADTATINATVNSGGAGKLYYFRGGTYTYTGRLSGYGYGGFCFTVDATQFNRNVLSAYPGETPIIDPNYGFSDDTSTPIIGISPTCDYMTVKGFEVTQTTYSGIMPQNERGQRTGVIIEDCHIHDIGATPIANYGGTSAADNIGGIRADHITLGVLRNNTISGIYDARNPGDNGFNAIPYNFHSGVHGYWPEELWIHNNTIELCGRAIFSKKGNDLGGLGHRMHNNLFKDVGLEVVSLEVAGSGQNSSIKCHFYHNLMVLDHPAAANTNTIGIGRFSHEVINTLIGYWYYGNTQIGGAEFIGSDPLGDVQDQVAFNNVYTPSDYFWQLDGRRPATNNVEYSDYNCFVGSPVFMTGRNDASVTSYTLAQWRTAHTTDDQLQRAAEANSIETAPTYVNAAGDDYRTTSGVTVGTGRFGRDIGIGNETVGAA